MKKAIAVLLVLIMIFSFCGVASATSFKTTVDGIKMSSGLNPVVKFIDGNKYELTLYAVDMDGITNADFSLYYTDNIVFEIFKEKGEFDMCVHYDAGDKLNISFINEEEDTREAFKLFTVTFSYVGEPTYPEIKLTHLAGTFIKTVAEIVFVNESGDVVTLIAGDINSDGKVNASDARLALRYGAKIENLTEAQLENADVNNDGKVNSADARLILRFSAGLEKGF